MRVGRKAVEPSKGLMWGSFHEDISAALTNYGDDVMKAFDRWVLLEHGECDLIINADILFACTTIADGTPFVRRLSL